MLQSLAGCGCFPCIFGVFDGELVKEIIKSTDDRVVKFLSMQKEDKLTSANWNAICFGVTLASKYIHLKNLVHNDLKSNDVLFKLVNNVWILKLADTGKFTLKPFPETYKLSNTQKDRYNKIYSYLAYALRDIYGLKISFSSDIFSLGYMFTRLYPSSSILQMLTSKMLVRDLKKRATIFYVLILYRVV